MLRAKLASVQLAANERDIVALGGPELRALARRKAVLGHVPALLAGESRLTTPVYVIWGEEDDLRVIEHLRTAPNKVGRRTSALAQKEVRALTQKNKCRFRARCTNAHQVHNLHLIDERSAPLVGSLRVFGVGGSFSFGSFFNIGDGAEALGGVEATAHTWATAWQVGTLLELGHRMATNARRETIVLATSVSAAAEPAVLMLAASLKVGSRRGSWN